MKHYKAKNYARQAGMTLIELSVVLLILVGLAGLLIPYVGSFVQKTHDSTNSANLSELNNAFIRFVSQENKLPHHMDSLVNDLAGATGTGTNCSVAANATAGKPYCGLLDTGVFEQVTYTQPANPSAPANAGEIGYASLTNAKINMIVNNKTTATNKTFGSYTDMINFSFETAGMMAGTASVPLIKVGPARDNTGAVPASTPALVQAHLAAALGKADMDYKPTCYDYVAFGLGDANGLVTKTIASAPVHYPEDATKGPVDYYNHYMAIVQVDKDNTTSGCTSITEAAKFLGVVMNVPAYPTSHLFGANSALAYTYENQLSGK